MPTFNPPAHKQTDPAKYPGQITNHDMMDDMGQFAAAAHPLAGMGTLRCACGDREAAACPGQWEPGCDLGANEKYVKVIDRTLGDYIERITAAEHKPPHGGRPDIDPQEFKRLVEKRAYAGIMTVARNYGGGAKSHLGGE